MQKRRRGIPPETQALLDRIAGQDFPSRWMKGDGTGRWRAHHLGGRWSAVEGLASCPGRKERA